ncbi:DGQHR domain-containing protein [Clostridium tagluense]|uniref:DGQHR domain-containing protein n=1 Tax=Clostridium tagluense TaxID=360422 RepID=UPI001C6F14E8|nr:DGQHR domain-containing protein [Clostridium tagluense]MBW9155514.1 DGQHR domain-containing protein [Clostridium tagluense]WLC66142.1 DGQHR domain-containing protein [Clostridium tagluense]
MTNSTLEIDVIEVFQPIGNLYIGKIDGNTLYKMAKADIRKITDNDQYLGIQRNLDRKRVEAIKKYIWTTDASFPNSIILNISSEDIVESSSNKLVLKISDNTFSIIDGQHRLAGFEEGNIESFELVVAIFVDLDMEQQAVLFSTINTEQKKVDPSFKYDLESYSSIETPRKVARDLALAFNTDTDSPWYRRIKMTGKKDRLSGDGIITLKAFIEPILSLIYPDKSDSYQIRDKIVNFENQENPSDKVKLNAVFDLNQYDNRKYIFWSMYVNEQEEIIFKILLNYYKALYANLKNDWGSKSSILTKTTGYNAIMYLLFDIYIIGMSKRDFSYEFFKEVLSPLKSLSGSLDSHTYGGSGESSSRRLYRDMIHRIKSN